EARLRNRQFGDYRVQIPFLPQTLPLANFQQNVTSELKIVQNLGVVLEDSLGMNRDLTVELRDPGVDRRLLKGGTAIHVHKDRIRVRLRIRKPSGRQGVASRGYPR